jgi:SAM-dependent methyltransferase
MELDRKRVQEFARRLFGHYTSGMLALMVDVGHKTGLFEAAAKGPATSAELAERAELNERYVREWLGAIVTGGIMDTIRLPARPSCPPSMQSVSRARRAETSPPTDRLLAMLAKRLPAVLECFKSGGGAYSEFRPDFTDYMDASWRCSTTDCFSRIPAGGRGTSGTVGREFALRISVAGRDTRSQPHGEGVLGVRPVGYDFAADAIERAREEARQMTLSNARFEVADVAHLPAKDQFELITSFDAIHDQRDPAAVLRKAAAALTRDGVYLAIEPRASSKLEENVQNPFAPWMYGVSVLHCMTVSLALGGAGLGTVWGEQTARRLLTEAGVRVRRGGGRARASEHHLHLPSLNQAYPHAWP